MIRFWDGAKAHWGVITSQSRWRTSMMWRLVWKKMWWEYKTYFPRVYGGQKSRFSFDTRIPRRLLEGPGLGKLVFRLGSCLHFRLCYVFNHSSLVSTWARPLLCWNQRWRVGKIGSLTPRPATSWITLNTPVEVPFFRCLVLSNFIPF